MPVEIVSTNRRGTAALAWLRRFAPLVLVLLLAAAGGCQRSEPASPQGDPRAAQRAAAQEGRPQGQAQGQGRQAQPSPSLLSSIDLGLVYQFILEGYVDRADHVTLIEAAAAAVRQSVAEASALPIDSAPMDFLPLPTGNRDRDWSAFGSAFDAVIQRHPQWSLEARPDYAAIRRMLQTLGDSHSSFLTPDEVRRRGETSYSGIGVRIARPEPQGPPVVVHIFKESPAGAAGLRVGDRVVAVGDRPVSQLPLGDVVDLVRGPQNSEVVLQIERSSTPGPIPIRAFRRALTAPDAEGALLDGGIGYIRIFSFGTTAAERVGSEMTTQRQQGARSWILDMRGNPGGSLETVSKVAGYFMDARPVAIAVDRDGQRQGIFAEQRPFRLAANTPVVVLIDGDTSSGAEVLAAALREYQLATLIGQKTAGSVGIATSRPLSDGSAVQLTINKLVSPSGAQLDRVGVQPDEAIPLTAVDLEAGRDPQRDRAVQVLVQRSGR